MLFVPQLVRSFVIYVLRYSVSYLFLALFSDLCMCCFLYAFRYFSIYVFLALFSFVVRYVCISLCL